jgi:hypothetical protein
MYVLRLWTPELERQRSPAHVQPGDNTEIGKEPQRKPKMANTDENWKKPRLSHTRLCLWTRSILIVNEYRALVIELAMDPRMRPRPRHLRAGHQQFQAFWVIYGRA